MYCRLKNSNYFVVRVLSVILTIVLGLVLSPTTSAQGGESHRIMLKARSFVPEAQSALQMRAAAEARHLLIQFDDGIAPADVAALEALGVNIVGGVPNNAVIAAIPAGVSLAQVGGIRWTGELLASDKLSDLTYTSLDKGYALVDFHADVDPVVARSIVSAAGGSIDERQGLSPSIFLIKADSAIINELANQDEVSYIFAASNAIIGDEKTRFCSGGSTAFGPVPNFVVGDNGWDGPGQGSFSITYNFTNGTADIAGSGEEADVIRGITEWAIFADLAITPTGAADATSSIQILWGTGNHDAVSGFTEGADFDGASGVLAHAFFPSSSETIRGDMHFDDAEDWSDGASSSFDLFSVALHEAGHSHGLGHSADTGAVMYFSSSIHTRLKQDDINGIQSIYAIPSGITVYRANGGDTFVAGQTETIIWAGGSNVGANVSIALYKSGVFQGFITTSTANDGTYDWAVPSGLTTSSAYTITIASTSTPAITDTSNSTFTIAQVSRSTFSSTDVPLNIPNNDGGAFFAAFSDLTVPGGVGTIVDVEVENIGIDYEDMGDLQLRLVDPVSAAQNIIMLQGHCSTTPLVSSAPFGLDDDAGTAIGSACPPVNGVSYVPDNSLKDFFQGIDPTGNWTLLVADTATTTPGADGTITSWDLVIGVSTADPGKFTPVYVDAAAASPGAGTSGTPFTIVEPAAATVSTGGDIQITPGTYSESPLTINTSMTLSRKTGAMGVVTIE